MNELISMNWNSVLFVNLEIDQNLLKKHVPKELDIRTFSDKSFITLVFFKLERPGIKGFSLPISITEFNIRTYVQYKSNQGIYFLTLDINNGLLPKIVNNIFKLNYAKNKVTYYSKKNENKIIWSNKYFDLNNVSFEFNVGESMQTNAFSKFITENYMYLSKPKNKIFYNNVSHKEWSLNHVKLNQITNFNILGKTVIHSAFYSSHLKVRTGLPTKLS